MWDYNKLFADGNIVGLKNKQQNRIFPIPVDGKEYWGKEGYVDWRDYYNESLSVLEGEDGGYGFEIIYVVRLDEHGNVAERLFDREKDMPKPMPELEDGMFIRVLFSGNPYDQTLGFINLKRGQIVYQDGGYDLISNMNHWIKTKIVEIYAPEAMSFTSCKHNEPIWRSPEYQAYLDSKSN